MAEKRDRIAIIDKKKCRPDKCGLPCIRFCPRVRAGDETIVQKGNVVEIAEELCIGCGICTKKCPYKAIKVINLAQELSDPSHQYAKNAFRLYGLPIPKKGQVTGLLGPNGVGKSTALQILSGQITPNLGRFDSPPTWDEVIQKFKGTELQGYLEKLKAGGIKTVLKPQQVDAIPKVFKGTPKALLKDADPKELENIAGKLEIAGILERDIANLSGGELQRVAIAAALLKEGDFYYFDEPSSYLDVRQRLHVAEAIRELAEKKGKSVLVVEHDLATLDYIADNLHIVYGEAGVYGIVSNPYAARRGINSYLDGYIREENVRFRDDELSFRIRRQDFEGVGIEVSYPDIEKSLGTFSIKIDSGDLYAGDVVGVFGANALGKTTFAKILAGEIEPDTGKLKDKIKISYKPQYLKSDYSGSVQEILSEKAKGFGTNKFKIEIMRPLGLEHLLENKVSELSGGELQRLSIALCLSQDSEFYLLDEPSAYLDVEERVKLAKTMRRFIETNVKSCLVIDHDLLLLNYISDKAIVFFGEPGKKGHAHAPEGLAEGMNKFLKELGITFRSDPDTGRPRANKLGSQMDQQQKSKGMYYCRD